MKSVYCFAFVALLFNAVPAMACKEYYVSAAAEQSDYVVIGQPTSMKLEQGISETAIRYKFHISKSLKGNLEGYIEITEPKAGCYGYRAIDEMPGDYLLFLSKKDGQLVFGHPYPNRKLPSDKKKADLLISKFIIAFSRRMPNPQ